MRKPHFYKAYCRIGIHNLPFGQKTTAKGVEEAPDYVLSDKFLNKFPDSPINSFGFEEPDLIDPLNYFQTILQECIKFQKELAANVKKNETLIIAGGDHSVTYSSILHDMENNGNNLGIIHFDSHADFNLYKSSPTKNFHGMYLRIFFDKFDLPFFDKTIKTKLSLEKLLFVGNLELDDEESNFFKTHNKMSVISSVFLKNHKDEALTKFKTFVKSYSHIHISFDVDVFDKKAVSATGTPAKDGFNKKDIFLLLDVLKEAKSFSLDIAEVNPRKKGAKKTIKIAQEVISKLLD